MRNVVLIVQTELLPSFKLYKSAYFVFRLVDLFRPFFTVTSYFHLGCSVST
jgi:hypothetical protein